MTVEERLENLENKFSSFIDAMEKMMAFEKAKEDSRKEHDASQHEIEMELRRRELELRERELELKNNLEHAAEQEQSEQ